VAPRPLPLLPLIANFCSCPGENPPAADGEHLAVTAPTTNTATTAAIAKPKLKVKKELTAAEREVQNQKRQAHRVAEQARKTEAFNAALEEEERLMIIAAGLWPRGHEDAGAARQGQDRRCGRSDLEYLGHIVGSATVDGAPVARDAEGVGDSCSANNKVCFHYHISFVHNILYVML
jgi:hypothetical protein